MLNNSDFDQKARFIRINDNLVNQLLVKKRNSRLFFQFVVKMTLNLESEVVFTLFSAIVGGFRVNV